MQDAPELPYEAAPRPAATASSRQSWRVRGVLLLSLIGGALLALAAMAAKPGLPLGFWLGLLGTAVASGSALLFVDTIRRVEPDAEVSARRVAWPVAHALFALVLGWGLVRLAVLGVVPAQTWVLALALPAVFLWLVAATGIALDRLGFLADPGLPLWRRHGFWLIALTTLMYLPRLGSFGLIDPWETHYGEVAREVLARDDWISLWWAQDGWFWSKPILNFWTQALSFAAFGVEFAPDRMIASVALGRTPQPEWAARLPVLLMALAGAQLMYFGARAYVGRLPAFLGALVLATTPYWYLLAHQSMADMAYVGPLAACMGCLLLALRADPERRARSVALKLERLGVSVQVSGYHLLFGVLLLLALPQVFYLLSRNFTLAWGDAPLRLLLHADKVVSGSPGNCGLPGNVPCTPDAAAGAGELQPAGAALLWASAGLALLWLRGGERRLDRLFYLGAWLCAGLSFMGKGAPGLVLALFTWGGFLFARGRFRELARAELLGFGLIMASVVLPWFVQEYVRHGSEFFERLFIHDMYKRAFSHVHDTNKGDDTSFRYYVWQLGYGLFPWSGIAAAGTLAALGRTVWLSRATPEGNARDSSSSGYVELTYFCVLWQLAAFGMFAITGTKFHHYILPLVPAAALPAGMLLAAFLAPARENQGQRPWLAEASVALGAAALVVLAGRDLALTKAGDLVGAVRILHLFTYNYARSWPGTLDYGRELWAFTFAGALLCLLLALPRLRRAAALGLCGLAVLVTTWVLDVYMIEVAPHWGQRELVAHYYQKRTGAEEPLIAFQLNWKGENFYTGNKVPAFVSSGKRFTDWVGSQKKNGVTTMFFITEHSRIGTLKRELGEGAKVELLTDTTLNDKFVLARAEL